MVRSRRFGSPSTTIDHSGRATALGTIFSVRSEAAKATVTVSEGHVEVVSPIDATDAASRVRLSAGQQVTYRESTGPGPMQIAAAQDLAWREGVIAIDNMPVADAIAEIDRYHPGRILLLAETDQLAPVTARLTLSAIDRGIDALAATQNLHVTRVTEYLILIR